jgi:hypothetical protein
MPKGSRWEHPWRGLLSSERTSSECVDYFSFEGDSALAVIGKKPDIHPFGCPEDRERLVIELSA